jgi:hypothetical protein
VSLSSSSFETSFDASLSSVCRERSLARDFLLDERERVLDVPRAFIRERLLY